MRVGRFSKQGDAWSKGKGKGPQSGAGRVNGSRGEVGPGCR